MRRIIFWATIASGAIAAYMMLKRGEPIGEVAQKAIGNPVGSLVNEMKGTAAA
jgi:hypothetical protein